MILSAYLSKKLSRLSFLGMLTVVYVHSFNFDDRYLWAGRPFSEELNVWNFIQVLVTNGLFRFGVPLFFFRAGLLMAETEAKYTALSRLKKRSLTLILPYVAWSLTGIGITWFFESRAEIAPFAEASWLRPFGNLPIHKWNLSQWFEGVIFQPVSFQLWFLKSLFIYSLLYPLLRKALTLKPYWFLGFFGLMWLTSSGFLFLFEGEGILFFSLGIFYAKDGMDPLKIRHFLSRFKVYWILPVILLGKTFLSFEFQGMEAPVYFLHKISQPLMVMAVWFGYDAVLGRFNKTPLESLSHYNFFIYGAHVPLVYYITDWIFAFYGKEDSMRFLVFVFLPVAVAMCAIIIGYLFEKLVYPLFWVFTGGRK